MTFKHKLSKRLALMRDVTAALTAAALVATCAPRDQSLSGLTTPSFTTSSDSLGTVLFQEMFEDNALAVRGWYDNASPVITTTQHIPGSTSALEMHFLTGALTAVAGGAMRHLFAASPTLYVSFWVKYSANWVGSGYPYHPHEFLIMSDQDGDWDGLSNGWLVNYIEHNYQNGGIPRLALQDSKAINTSYGTPPINLIGITENRSVGGCNGVVESNVVISCFSFPPWYNNKEVTAPQVWFQPNPGPGYKGNWNHVEVYLQLNSVVGGIGVADGVMQYWFNGTLAIDRHDILFRTGARPTIQFHQFVIAPYMGDGSPVDQYMWVDDLVAATNKITSVAAVASVTVSPASASLAVAATQQLTATLKDAIGTILTDRAVTWTSSNPAAATVSAGGLVTALAAGSATISASSESVQGTAVVSVATPVTKPGTVTDLAVVGVSDTSATLTFTEVSDGTGVPASYLVRFAVAPLDWGTASDVALGTCRVPMAGTAIGAKRTCTVMGLEPGTTYGLQLVNFRGTLNVNAVFGGLSTAATGTTALKSAPVASVTVSPASSNVTAGQTVQLTATLNDGAGKVVTNRPITWASSNSAMATVSGSGLVSAVRAGSPTITATSDGVPGTAAVTVTTPTVTQPGSVTDLGVSGASDTSVALAFTDVTDGTGVPASYLVRFAVAPLDWGTGSDVILGTCRVPMVGVVIGTRRSCTVQGLQPGTGYQFQLVSFRGTLNVNEVFGALSNAASGTTAATPPPVSTNPGTVADLAVSAVTDSSVTLSFIEVNDGTGQAARYEIREAVGTALYWPTAPDVARGSCSMPMAGTSIGARRSCTVLGLQSGTAYHFQLAAFRGTLSLDAVFGGLSNVADGTTVSSTVVPPGGVVFQSDWSTATGTSSVAVRDGTRWLNYWEFNNGTSVQLLSVVGGFGPGGRNALKVVQRGSSYAAAVQQDNVLPPSTDYYVRYYMRNDDNSSPGDHVVTPDSWLYPNLTYMRKYSSSAAWRFVMGTYGCGYTYPIDYMGPRQDLAHGVWYRFEYWVHFVDPTHIQVHPRVYDAAGTLLYSDADFLQEDYGGSGLWNGSQTWSLASYYAAGYSYCVVPAPLTSFGMGNNGQAGALDTGLSWYFAAVQIRTDRWPGP